MYSFVPLFSEMKFCVVPSCVFDKLGCAEADKKLGNADLRQFIGLQKPCAKWQNLRDVRKFLDAEYIMGDAENASSHSVSKRHYCRLPCSKNSNILCCVQFRLI
jgi:hypothetical protein